MNLIWKRPDGYHGAMPDDFSVIKVGGHSNLWVHKTDRDTFPFRISGGWEEEEETRKLNNLVNMLNAPETEWLRFLERSFDHSMRHVPKEYFQELTTWIRELKKVAKGGNWEIEIMIKALDSVEQKLLAIESKFVSP